MRFPVAQLSKILTLLLSNQKFAAQCDVIPSPSCTVPRFNVESIPLPWYFLLQQWPTRFHERVFISCWLAKRHFSRVLFSPVLCFLRLLWLATELILRSWKSVAFASHRTANTKLKPSVFETPCVSRHSLKGPKLATGKWVYAPLRTANLSGAMIKMFCNFNINLIWFMLELRSMGVGRRVQGRPSPGFLKFDSFLLTF